MVYFARCWVQREPLWGAVRGIKPSLSVSLGRKSEMTQVTSDDRFQFGQRKSPQEAQG